MSLCTVTYLYRDAGNYKFWGKFVVNGYLRIDTLRPFLFESEFFLPDKVGIPVLTPQLKNSDDHPFHEIHDIAPARSGFCAFTARELLALFQRAYESGWS